MTIQMQIVLTLVCAVTADALHTVIYGHNKSKQYRTHAVQKTSGGRLEQVLALTRTLRHCMYSDTTKSTLHDLSPGTATVVMIMVAHACVVCSMEGRGREL